MGQQGKTSGRVADLALSATLGRAIGMRVGSCRMAEAGPGEGATCGAGGACVCCAAWAGLCALVGGALPKRFQLGPRRHGERPVPIATVRTKDVEIAGSSSSGEGGIRTLDGA